MAYRTPLVPLVLACSVLAGASVTSQGQARDDVGSDGRVPRTASGHPDLRGFWTNDNLTPLERPVEFGDRQVLTADEAAAYTERRVARWVGQPQDNVHYDDVIWQREAYAKESLLRTSLIVEPANGRVPPLTQEGERRAAARADSQRQAGPADSAEARSLAERCISWGNVGPPMLPPTYGANFQILQTGDHVVIRHELMDGLRLIPVDGRPHVNAGIRRLAGDSRGHWNGDTLVVETTNFTGRTNFRGPPGTTRQDIFASETLRVEERFTLVDADTIRYQFTVEDPTIWTTPWSGELPIRRFEGPLYEFACHEGNYGLANILRGARAAEQGGKDLLP